MRSHSGMLALSPHPIEQLDSLVSWYFLLTLVTYWVYLAHLLVGLQVVQKAVPVFGVVIDSVVSDAVDIGQNPLSILGNQFLFSFCNMKSRLHSARHRWDKCGTDWQAMKNTLTFSLQRGVCQTLKGHQLWSNWCRYLTWVAGRHRDVGGLRRRWHDFNWDIPPTAKEKSRIESYNFDFNPGS